MQVSNNNNLFGGMEWDIKGTRVPIGEARWTSVDGAHGEFNTMERVWHFKLGWC